jgi:hypothetical protein
LVNNKTPLKEEFLISAKGKPTKDTKIYMTITCDEKKKGKDKG